MRRSISLILMMTICVLTNAQQIFEVGVGPVAGLPIANANFSYYYKTGFGFNLQSFYHLAPLGSLSLDYTYLSMEAEQKPVEQLRLSILKVGYKTDFKNSNVFLKGDIGIGWYNAGSKRPLVAASLGYNFKITQSINIKVFPSYTRFFRSPLNSQWLTGNVLCMFSFKKK